MAGIGFELKKIFKRGSIWRSVKGTAYAMATTIGPTLLVVLTLLLSYIILKYSTIPYTERDLLASTILYVFIFSLIVTTPLNSVLSRYIADKIYEEKPQDIIPSFYMGLCINIVVAAVMGIPFCIHEYVIGKVDILIVYGSYLMYMTLAFAFFSMTYISALKEYKKILFAFVIGLAVGLVLSIILVYLFNVMIIAAIIYSFAVAFLIIGFMLLSQIRHFFGVNSGNYRDTLKYLKQYKFLLFANLFYILGLYCHNFVFWFTDLHIIVVETFRSAPAYDMATCLAMFTNISAIVIFIVQVELNFHEKYKLYCQAVLGGAGKDIELAKREMFRTLVHEIFFIVQLQLIITSIIFFIAIIFLPSIGFGGYVMEIYPALAAAYFVLFVMYCMIIFLYYFDDEKGAFFTSMTFFIFTLLGAIVATYLEVNWYGIGLFIGAVAGWTYSFYRIRKIEKSLDTHIFCKGEIVKTIISSNPINRIFKN